MADNIVINVSANDVNASSTFSTLGGKVIALNQGLELTKKAFSVLTSPIKSVISEGRSFSSQMSAIRSVTKLTSEEFSSLSDEAKRIGSTTSFTATEAGSAMEELARAGQSSSEILRNTQDAMALSAATGTDLATSAKTIALQLNSFGQAGLTAEKAADLMTQTVGSSPQGFEDLNQALLKSGPTAAALGIEFDDLTQVLGAMADSGQRGELAGTALNSAFVRLLNPASDGKKVLQELGVSLDQVNPKTNNFADVLDTLKEAGISQTQVFRLLGQEAGPKFIQLFEKGGDAVRGFADKQKEANTASEAASERLNNLDGDITKFESAMSGLRGEVFESLNPLLRDITQFATGFVSNFSEILPGIKNNFADILDAVADFIEPMEKALGEFLKENKTAFNEMGDAALDIIDDLFKIGAFIAEKFGPNIQVLTDLILALAKFAVQSFSNLTGAIVDVIENFDLLVEYVRSKVTERFSFLNDLVDTVTEAFRTFGTVIKNNVVDPLIDVVDSIGDAGKPLRDLAEWFGLADEKAQGLDHTLTGNTVTVSLQETGKEAVTAAGKLREIADAFRTTDTDAGKAEEKIKDTEKALKDLDKTAGTVDKTLDSSFAGVGDVLASSGEQLASQIVGVSGALQGGAAGSPVGAVVGAATEILLANEGFKSAVGELNSVIVELMDPIAEAIAPAIKALVPLVRALKPIFEVIGRFLTIIVDALMPVFEALLPLLELVAEAFEAMEPVIKLLADIIADTIGEVLVPVLKALKPVFEELAPLIEILGEAIGTAMQFLDPFIRLFREIIRIGLVNSIGLFNEAITALNTTLLNIKDFFEGLWEGLENILEQIKNAFKVDLGGGGGGGIEGFFSDPAGSIGSGIQNLFGSRPSPATNVTFNVQSVDPQAQSEEIRQMLEEMSLTGRLAV